MSVVDAKNGEVQGFSSVPALDFALLDGQKGRFLAELRHILVNVGFLYLDNPPIDEGLIDRVSSYTSLLFDLPQESKDLLTMRNSEHFFGYNRLGSEFTRGARDLREQFDFGVDFENDWAPGKPDYLRMWGNAQWPVESQLPGFKSAVTEYFTQLGDLSFQFISLVAEALDLPPDAFDPFYTPGKHKMQHRGKFVKYPPVKLADDGNQGVGPHYDGQFLTLLLQVTELPGLQAQNLSGDWIDVPPKKGTLVINFGKGLETVTRGVVLATSHRVISPGAGSPARYSIPFFQIISQGIHLEKMRMDLPAHVLMLKEARGQRDEVASVNYSEYATDISGLVSLIGRVRSHPDVAELHYPDLFKKYFPDGRPAFGSAY